MIGCNGKVRLLADDVQYKRGECTLGANLNKYPYPITVHPFDLLYKEYGICYMFFEDIDYPVRRAISPRIVLRIYIGDYIYPGALNIQLFEHPPI